MPNYKLADEKNIELKPRASHELLEMHKKLMIFLSENEYSFIEEEGFIKVQISPLKLQERATIIK